MKNGDVKTLKEWFEILQIKTTVLNGYDSYISSTKKERNGFIDIYKYGYGLRHDEVENELEQLYFIHNVDINDMKLEKKYW